MINFTNSQLEKLWEMTELHFKCFRKYYPEYGIVYADVLELNHRKLINISEGLDNNNKEILDLILDSIIEEYIKILNDDEPFMDDFFLD